MVVGCTPEQYSAIVHPRTLFALQGDADAYKAKQQEVYDLQARKAQHCVTVVMRGIASVALGDEHAVPALYTRLGSAQAEPLEVNLTEVAHRIEGSLVAGSTTVRLNASQCIKDLLRKHAADVLSMELLSSPGDCGVHEARRAHSRVRGGNRLVRGAHQRAGQSAPRPHCGW